MNISERRDTWKSPRIEGIGPTAAENGDSTRAETSARYTLRPHLQRSALGVLDRGGHGFQCQTGPDRLITDVRLGDFNGLQLLAMHPLSIPAIVVTGFPDPVLEAQARQFGATFLLKPFEPAGLVTIVEELLRDRDQ